MFLLYTIIYIFVLIFILPFEYLKRPKELRKKWLREKFGFFNLSFTTYSSSYIWVHAVSVGEVMASIPFLGGLKENYPSRKIILSTITDTGQKVAKEKAPQGVITVYLPFDIPFIIERVLKKVNPEILILIETELWPNLLKKFKGENIPIILLNGRISEKSLRGYQKISFFMKKVLSYVDFFGMQNEIYAERIKKFDINSNKISNLGNFKFDITPSSYIPEWIKKIQNPIIIAGSTHEGEEDLLSSVYVDLKKDFSDLNFIIAPRHPERFKEVEEMLKAKGIKFIKRTALNGEHNASQKINGTIIILDTIGELSSVYQISDIAIIGKSFYGYGGQNPFEPAFWGKPIICGPHMENFPIIQDFYKEGAAIEVQKETLYFKLKELLLNPEKSKDIGSKAKELYQKNSGSVGRALGVIQRYISP